MVVYFHNTLRKGVSMGFSRENILLNTLDNPTRVLFWTVDVFAFMVIPVFLGILLSSLIVMLLGFVLVPFYGRFKKRFPRGVVRHKMYWLLPHEAFLRFGKLKSFPPSHEREMIL
jgi:conjugal transfer pilus assembly protein TraL